MNNEEFCKMVTAYDGEEVSDIKQIELMSFNGEELKEFVEHCFKLKNNGALGNVVGRSEQFYCYADEYKSKNRCQDQCLQ